MSRSPASILFDVGGHPVGVIQDGVIYRLQVQSSECDPQSGIYQDVSPFGQASVAQVNRLVGGNFYDPQPDLDEWDLENARGGTYVIDNGLITLSTGSNPDGYSRLISSYSAKFVSGQVNRYLAGVRLPDLGVADNARRWGACNSRDGFYFELAGTSFQLGIMNSEVATYINNGSFNGNLGATYSLDTNFHVYIIDYVSGSVRFYIDRVLLHKYTASTSSSAGNMDLPLAAQTENSNGLADIRTIEVRGQSISRLGSLDTARIGQEVLPDQLVTSVVKAVLTGKKPNETYGSVSLDRYNRIQTESKLETSALEPLQLMVLELRRIRTLLEILTDETVREEETES